MKTVSVPLPAALAVGMALALSLIGHIIAISVYGSIAFTSSPSTHAEFPIPIREAVLTTVKSSRFGLHTNDSDWDYILPSGEGFLFHPQDGQHYLLAHYHQLHCLRSLRHYLKQTMLSEEELKSFKSIDIGHVDHCLIYLREMTLCNVDLTLEPPSHRQKTPGGRVVDAVTGLGVNHRCRDWEQVWEYMEDNFEANKERFAEVL